MRQLIRFLRLSRAQRRVLLFSGTATFMIRMSLWVLPSRMVLGYVRRRTEASGPERMDEMRPSMALIAWGVRVSARRIPDSTCLTQALAAQLVLARHGYPSRLRIGVGRDDAGNFAAHAWVEAGGRNLIGGEIAHRYVALPEIDDILLGRIGEGRGARKRTPRNPWNTFSIPAKNSRPEA